MEVILSFALFLFCDTAVARLLGRMLAVRDGGDYLRNHRDGSTSQSGPKACGKCSWIVRWRSCTWSSAEVVNLSMAAWVNKMPHPMRPHIRRAATNHDECS